MKGKAAALSVEDKQRLYYKSGGTAMNGSVRKKLGAACIGLSILGLLLGGCGSSPSSSAAAEKSEISIAMNAEPETYDLTKTTATVAKEMMLGNVFEMLVSFDENYQAQPELAEKIDVSPDYRVYTYHLRKGVMFHNGQEMKADDVAASMNRWIDSNGMAKMGTGGARFTKMDDYTVQISMEKPMMTLNDMIAGLRPVAIIVPKSVIDKADPKTGMISEYIGTGPYMVDKLVQNSYLQLKKFDQYKPYGEKGKSSGWVGYKEAKTPVIIYHFVTDSSTRVAGMQSGTYDLAIQMPFDDYDQFNGKSDYQIFKENQGEIGITYNKKKGIAADRLIRQAVNTALNREDIMKASYVKPDFYKITPSFITEEHNFWYTEAGKEVYNQSDPARAKALLQQAGYDGTPFRLLVSSQYQEFYNAAIVVQKELEDIGMNVQLDTVDWATYLTKAKDPNAYDAFITGFATWPVPNTILYLSPTWNGWSDDKQLQDMMDSISHSTDKKAAKAEWEKLQMYAWSDYVPESKLGNRYIYDVASSKVKDMEFFEGPHMWNMTVSE